MKDDRDPLALQGDQHCLVPSTELYCGYIAEDNIAEDKAEMKK